MKKKIVLCGSMQDLSKFREIKKKFPEYTFFPTEEHLEKITETVRLVDAPIPNQERLALILEHLTYLREADEVWVLNEKWISKEGETGGCWREYVGIGTALDIGYALAMNKKIKWFNRPTDPNLIALFEDRKTKILTVKEN